MITKVKIDKHENSLEAEMPISLNCHERVAIANALIAALPEWDKAASEIITDTSYIGNAIKRLFEKIAIDTHSYWEDIPIEAEQVYCSDEDYKRGLVLAVVSSMLSMEAKENAK